jgi:hypothetical protein
MKRYRKRPHHSSRSLRSKGERSWRETMLPQNNGDDEAIALLEETSLVSFKAVPTALGPFESTTLSWHVKAPAGVRIVLDGGTVDKAGEKVLEPAATHAYNLSARAGSGIKPLGNVVVSVNVAQCRISDLDFLDAWIRASILSQASMLPDGARFREDPEVTVTPGQIEIVLKLSQNIVLSKSPSVSFDASADITARFGLTLVPDTRGHLGLGAVTGRVATRLASAGETHSVDVSVPWYLWLIPGAMIGLPIAESMAEGSIGKSVPPLVQAIVDGLDADIHPFTGLVKQSLKIDRTENNVAFLETMWCPSPQQVLTTGIAAD